MREKQSKFVLMIAKLINFAYDNGFKLTFGDAARMDRQGHAKNSKHYERLAIDLNLFKDGIYLLETKDHLQLGNFWESIGGTWGGRFNNPDGNHYEL
jgi:hypothetical protein